MAFDLTCANKLGGLDNTLAFAICTLLSCPSAVQGSPECLILNGVLYYFSSISVTEDKYIRKDESKN